MKTRFLGIIWMLFAITGCIHEDLDECKTGNIKVNVYVERFQSRSLNALEDTEEHFIDRIQHLRYYLYRGDELQEQGIVTDFSAVNGGYYTFERQNLAFGNYRLILVCNSTKTKLPTNLQRYSDIALTYPAIELVEDYFSADFPFRVDCTCTTRLNVKLSRMLGVTRYTFKNLPPDVSGVEVVMGNVGQVKQISGDYSGNMEVSKFFPANLIFGRAASDLVIGTFPTSKGKRSTFQLRLYTGNSSTPFYDEVVTDTLQIERNQLLDVTATFTNGKPQFNFTLDNTWDGTVDGGGTDIE